MADFKHGVAGGIAGITVDCVFYPLQTIKTRIMASKPGQNLRSIALSKFKGFSCQMTVSFPYAFTFFYTYETVRYLLPSHVLSNAAASVMAQVTANIVRNPFQVVKQQLMVGRGDKISHSLAEILKNKGFKGFYTGLQTTLIRDILFSAIQLPLFEKLREKNIFGLAPVPNASVSGALAAAFAGFVSCPLDVIKTREMTQDFKLKNTEFIVKQIYEQYGLQGFFRGVGFRCGILSFGGIIYFGALQKARIWLNLEQYSKQP